MMVLRLLVACCLFTAVQAFTLYPPVSIPHGFSWRSHTVLSVSPSGTTSASTSARTKAVQEVLELAQELGPVGILQSEQDQERLLNKARGLAKYSDPEPAKRPLQGTFDLVYSAAPGGSNGRVGPFTGKVTQTFVNDTSFINAVDLGPLRISLAAEKKIRDDVTNPVVFFFSSVQLLGNTLVEKQISGGGVWKYLFMGTIQGPDGQKKLVRVMETPSLFVLTQDVGDDD